MSDVVYRMSDRTDINVGHNVRYFKIFFIYTDKYSTVKPLI